MKRPTVVTFAFGSYSETFVSTSDADLPAGYTAHPYKGATLTIDRILPGPIHRPDPPR